MNLIKIKAGDYVWVGNRYSTRHELKRVVRVTPTRIILDGLPEYNMYKRVDSDRRQDAGYAYGRSWSMNGDHITFLATRADRKKWDDEKKRKEAAAADREAKQERKEALRKELSDALPGDIDVEAYNHGNDEPTLNYGVIGLSEDQVRRIARFLKRGGRKA